jgi:transcriptional regulator GlxA family with amidase domain
VQTVAALIFPDFELLDLFGPLEMFGMLPEHFAIRLVAERERHVASAQGPVSRADDLFADDLFANGRSCDILLLPGGPGTRREVNNPALLDWLRAQAEGAAYVASVCTGSALLARAGLLDGRTATSNKQAFAWVQAQGPRVDWQARARWVEDGRFFTSSGVSAGIDMSLALIARLHGEARARQVAAWAEYDWHSDPGWDPFAELHGLV